uniref:Neuropeptide GPCR A36 n=1 Tax=Nilaparvata lugens TaxID=108931 RepID=U3U4G2_NILLU|nr:neuropeptide GPCR A36 [Nilaparvata lugens]
MGEVEQVEFLNRNVTDYIGSNQFIPKRDPLYIVIPLTVLYSLILLTGIVGNVVTCVVISRNRHMHTATNYYLFSLAVSDLLQLVSGLPQEIYYVWSRYPYIFGEAFCVLRGLAAETSANATVLTITAFTVERYLAICHPFLAQTMSRLSRAIRLILIIWCVALAFAVPQALQVGIVNEEVPDGAMCALKPYSKKDTFYLLTIFWEHSFALSTILFFLVPMTIITVLYALIGLRLRKSALLKKSSGSFSNNYNRKPTCRQQSSQRVLKMLVAVVVAFFICWAPFHAQRLLGTYLTGPAGSHSSTAQIIYVVVTYLSGILYYMSTTVNPILYHIMSLKFREAFKVTLASCCCAKDSRSYVVLSRRQYLLGGTDGHRQAILDSVTDSANSCVRCTDDAVAKTPQTSCLLNDTVTKNPPDAELLRSAPAPPPRRLSWMPSCIAAAPPQRRDDNQLGVITRRTSDISNSSLKDVDRAALQDELSSYMNEIARRQLAFAATT